MNDKSKVLHMREKTKADVLAKHKRGEPFNDEDWRVMSEVFLVKELEGLRNRVTELDEALGGEWDSPLDPDHFRVIKGYLSLIIRELQEDSHETA